MAGYAKFFVLLLSVLLFSACTGTNNVYVDSLEGQRRALVRDFAQALSKEGGKLILVGDTVRMIFPEQIVFYPCSANLNPSYYRLLDDVARIMRHLEAISVQVAGYSTCKPSYVLNRSLSKRQAEVVAEYLFNRGLDARLVHTVGEGTRDPVVRRVGAAANCRIEISFQYLPLLKQY